MGSSPKLRVGQAPVGVGKSSAWRKLRVGKLRAAQWPIVEGQGAAGQAGAHLDHQPRRPARRGARAARGARRGPRWRGDGPRRRSAADRPGCQAAGRAAAAARGAGRAAPAAAGGAGLRPHGRDAGHRRSRRAGGAGARARAAGRARGPVGAHRGRGGDRGGLHRGWAGRPWIALFVAPREAPGRRRRCRRPGLACRSRRRCASGQLWSRRSGRICC